MLKRTFGNTGIEVSILGYGAMELMREDQAKDAQLILNRVLDEGINFIDTAPCYFDSEANIGKAISHRRDEYILATKCGCVVSGDPFHQYDRATFTKNIENSLRAMKTDHVDLLQIHALEIDSLPGGEADDALMAMQEMKAAGKIRCICATFKNSSSLDPKYPEGYSTEGIKAFKDWKVFDVIQLVYGGLTRKCELGIDALAATGKGVIARGCMKEYWPNYGELYDKAGFSSLLEDGESKNDFLLRFTISHPHVTTSIVGTKNMAHLLSNIEAARRGPLAPDVYAKAKQMMDSVGQTALPL